MSIFNGKSLCGSPKVYFSPFPASLFGRHFCSTVIFNFFQIIMVSLFRARHDQYFMFKDSKVFEFTSFPFKTKFYNTVVYSVNSNYLFSKGKQEKIVETTIWLNLLRIYWYSAKARLFLKSPNPLTESYFTRELRQGSLKSRES